MSAYETFEYSTTTEKGTATVFACDEGDARQYFFNHPLLNYQGQNVDRQLLYNGDVNFTPTDSPLSSAGKECDLTFEQCLEISVRDFGINGSTKRAAEMYANQFKSSHVSTVKVITDQDVDSYANEHYPLAHTGKYQNLSKERAVFYATIQWVRKQLTKK